MRLYFLNGEGGMNGNWRELLKETPRMVNIPRKSFLWQAWFYLMLLPSMQLLALGHGGSSGGVLFIKLPSS